MGWCYVNCRIGSLEISEFKASEIEIVNCRIGSLESVSQNGTSRV